MFWMYTSLSILPNVMLMKFLYVFANIYICYMIIVDLKSTPTSEGQNQIENIEIQFHLSLDTESYMEQERSDMGKMISLPHEGFRPKPLESKLLASIQACKTRTIITAEQAVQIFKIKLTNQNSLSKKKNNARKIAEAFGISDKAVRDIWSGRTWLRETMHLDPVRIEMAASRRPPGRPKIFESRLHSQSKPSSFSASVEGVPSQSAARSLPTPSLREADKPPTAACDAALRQETKPFPAAAAIIAAALSSCWDSYSRQRCFDKSWAAPLPVGEAEAPLPPPSSRADDPFHDDWEHWP